MGDLVDFANVLRKENLAAGGRAQRLERALRALRFPALFLAQQADAIDQDFALLRCLDQVFQTHHAGVVVAVGNHHQDFLILVGLLLQVVDGHADGVAHGRAAARIDARQGFFHFLDVAGEGLAVRIVQESLVVEIDDEDLVVGVGILDQRQRRGFHLGALIPHAAAVVDDESHGNRNVFAVENPDRLLYAVFVHREGVL